MTVLVTGGAGYIGSHTVRALRDAGRDVVVLDTLEFGRPEAVLDAPLVEGDIHDSAAGRSRSAATTASAPIVHFAAYKSVGESMQSPGKYWHNNVDGTAALVEAAMRAGVRDFVFSSSCSVYGTPAEVPVDESAPIAPESVYAEQQGDGRADPALVRRHPGLAVGRACATSTPPAPASTRSSARTGRSRSTSSRS